MSRERVYALDWIRGIAVIGMVLHHALFSLEQVSWIFGDSITFWVLETKTFWVLQEIFVGLFLLVSGICTAYSRNVLRRGLIVTGAAALITLVTGVLLPLLGVTGLEIWFGILHMIGISMLLYGLFICKKPWVPVATAIGLFIIYLAMINLPDTLFSDGMLAVIGLPQEGFYSADYYPLLPYFFVFLAGTFLGPMVQEHRLPERFYTLRIRSVEWVGRHSLWVYLAHQPILFGIFGLIYYFMYY
ncbi:MAG: DUF1624 domain-containing protein [Clostridia bacterium]|nr:DUF1624 domain-containing protein [Clostridia bacterium]